MFSTRTSKPAVLAPAAILALGAYLLPGQASAGYIQENLVSDIPGLAANTDSNLKNPWGISSSPTGPFWVSNNGTGLSTLYNTGGTPQGLVVTVPPPPGGQPPSAPTGQVFNGTSANFSGDRFIFATEGGTIAGWQGGTAAATRVDHSTSANYKGLAIDDAVGRIYAADFKSGSIDAFDSTYTQVAPAGGFTDPNLPAGYAPFNIQNTGGHLLVTYAQQGFPDPSEEKTGRGLGFVDEFDNNGNLLKRLISGGALNAPWGLALAPGDFGDFSNDLLVGNFGDGRINAFDPLTGNFLGFLKDAKGNPIEIEGLWGLTFGNGGNGGVKNKLYFTAGIAGPDQLEDHGLFGSLSVSESASVPEPGSLSLIGLGLAGLGFGKRRLASRN